MSGRPSIDEHEDAGGLDPVGGSAGGLGDGAIDQGMSIKAKLGLKVAPETERALAALSFLTGRTRSSLVEQAIAAEVDRLGPDERARFAAALSARGGSE